MPNSGETLPWQRFSNRTSPKTLRGTWHPSSVPCWRLPWTPSSSTSMPMAVVWRRTSLTNHQSWSPSIMRCPCTRRLQTHSSRPSAPPRPAKVRCTCSKAQDSLNFCFYSFSDRIKCKISFNFTLLMVIFFSLLIVFCISIFISVCVS